MNPFKTREEIEAHDLETLRAWLKTNDRNGDWDDDPDPYFGWVLTHEEAVDLIWESCSDFLGIPPCPGRWNIEEVKRDGTAPCDKCSVSVRERDFCGDVGVFLCPDCYHASEAHQ